MSEFVNKVKKDNQEYNIQDARIPEVTAEDADKYLHVNAETGALEYEEVQGGGGEPTYLEVDLTSSEEISTLEDLIEALDWDYQSGKYEGYLSVRYYGPAPWSPSEKYAYTFKGFFVMQWQGGNFQVNTLNFETMVKDSTQTYKNAIVSNSQHNAQPSETLKNFLSTTAASVDINAFKLQNAFAYPSKPSDTSKTYVLKCVNGTMQWVEEQA